MGIKELVVVVSVVLSASCATIPAYQSTPNYQSTLEESVFKKFVFSMCIGTVFDADAVKRDANRSVNAYRVRGNMPPVAIDESRKLVDEWLEKSYQSKSGEQINLMKCIDLYNSNELLEIYNQYSPCKDNSNWYDADDYIKQCGS